MRTAVMPLVGTEAGRAELTVGAGGDRTVEVDRVAEETVVAFLEELARGGHRFALLSEELGRREFGAELPLVILDPIDGSLNAKQGIPAFGVMLSLATGDRVESLRAGYVCNLVSGQTWHAVRGGGAYEGTRRIQPLRGGGGERFQVLGLESSPRSLLRAQKLVERAEKIRILGSMALSIVHAATGGFDAFCAPIPARVFDMSASLVVLSEAGGIATDIEGSTLDGIEIGLGSRTTLIAASTAHAHRLALQALA